MNARHKLSFILVLLVASVPALAQASDPIAHLGVQAQDVPAALASHLGLAEGEGVFVAEVQEGSPAQLAGIKTNDIILSIDGEAVRGAKDFQEDVHSLSPGSRVRLELIHKGAAVQLEATLDALETESQALPRALQPFPRQAQSSQHYHSVRIINGESVEVSIDGALDDPASQMTVKNKDGSFTVALAELETLPDPAREQARSALEQARSSLTPGALFGPAPFQAAPFDVPSLLREMERLHQEQQQRLNDWMRQPTSPTPTKAWPGALKS